MRTSASLASLVLFIFSFGPTPQNQSTLTPPLEDTAQTNSATQAEYSFAETRADGSICQTGAKKFLSHKKMCLGLQDSAFNNGCARKQRDEKFQNACPDTPRSIGRECTISVGHLVLASEGVRIPKDKILSTNRFCVGPQINGPMLAGFTYNDVTLYDNIVMNMQSASDSETWTTAPFLRNYIKIRIKERGAREPSGSIGSPTDFGGGIAFQLAPTPDRKYSVMTECREVVACDLSE